MINVVVHHIINPEDEILPMFFNAVSPARIIKIGNRVHEIFLRIPIEQRNTLKVHCKLVILGFFVRYMIGGEKTDAYLNYLLSKQYQTRLIIEIDKNNLTIDRVIT